MLRTLADHRRFELTACGTACERYVVLDHAALAARSGWNAPLDALRRRLACRRYGARTGSVLIGYAGTGTGRNATDGRWPIEAPSLEALAGWDVDLEDEECGIEGAL